MRILLAGLAAILFMTGSGCAYLTSLKVTRESLDDTLRDYHQLVRWQEAPSTAVFVSEPMREAYFDKATGFNRVKVVDYRIKAVDFSQEQKKATVVVEYDYHLKSGVAIRTIADTQKWEYQDAEKPEGWRLTSHPPAFP